MGVFLAASGTQDTGGTRWGLFCATGNGERSSEEQP